MAQVTRKIGLSLGADLDWPGAFEEIIKRLDLKMELGSNTVDIAVERVTVEPFNLQQPCKYDVVLDRLTHWFHTSREWIKKAVIMDGLYVLNNPWSLQSMEKHTTYAAMMQLGFPIPETWMVPPREATDYADAQTMLARYARQFDIAEVGDELGYPLFMKPYDGGAWVGVTRIDSSDQLREVYAHSGQRVMHLQKSAEPFDVFVRCVGIGPQVEIIRYDPHAPLHERYMVDFFFTDGEQWKLLQDTTLTINTFFNWEFNSCEALLKEGVFYPIDFANACPDFQVTSLNYHFPAMVKNMVRWAVFCAATKRVMRQNLDWSPYYAIMKKDLPFRERLSEYAKIAHERLQTEQFAGFCQKHLSQLDEVVWEYFGEQSTKDLVRAKVAALYPQQEVEAFTEHFWGLIQFWRKTERDCLDAKSGIRAKKDGTDPDTNLGQPAPENAKSGTPQIRPAVEDKENRPNPSA